MTFSHLGALFDVLCDVNVPWDSKERIFVPRDQEIWNVSVYVDDVPISVFVVRQFRELGGHSNFSEVEEHMRGHDSHTCVEWPADETGYSQDDEALRVELMKISPIAEPWDRGRPDGHHIVKEKEGRDAK